MSIDETAQVNYQRCPKCFSEMWPVIINDTAGYNCELCDEFFIPDSKGNLRLSE